VRSEVDRRVVNLELTADGVEVARKIPTALCESMNAHLAGFSRTEWQDLKGYLQRILANADLLRDEV
jgi:DNA-binding MarR family transcriptional regulator